MSRLHSSQSHPGLRDCAGRQPQPRRILAATLVAIVGATLALLVLGWIAVQRQREGLEALTRATRRLQVERLANALEQQVTELARAVLVDPRLDGALRDLDWSAPDHLYRLRRTLDTVCTAHRVCADLVVVRDAVSGLPRLDEPLPRSPSDLMAGTTIDTSARALLVRRLESAMAREHSGDRAGALALYAAMPEGPGLQAAVLAGQARVQAATDADRARAAWARLAIEHPDEYDLAHRPYAVVAAIEVYRLTREGSAGYDAPSQRLVEQVRREFLAGRWPISPGQAEYFAVELGVPGRMRESGRPDAGPPRLFTQFAVARAVRRHLSVSGSPEGGEVRPLSLPGGQPVQTFIASSASKGDGPLIMALTLDLDAVRTHVWPAVRSLDEHAGGQARLMPASDGTPFRSAFRFWTIDWTADAAGRSWPRELLIFGGTTGGVLSVLVFGILLLVRDLNREAATARFQADLVSGVSHELKTPLSVIRLYSESLLDEATAPHETRAYSAIILHESERLGHLVERVLDVATPDEHNVPPLERHAPGELVDAFLERYGLYLAHHGVTPTVEIERDLPDVLTNAASFHQALVNLVDNALKYSEPPPTLILRVRARPSWVVIEVEDRGVGIPEEERVRIVEPFRRGSRTAGRGGYGLGLYLVNRVAAAHGGHLELASPIEGGTCVRLVLPTVQGSAE